MPSAHDAGPSCTMDCGSSKILLNRVKLADAIERFLRDRRGGRGVNIEEFAPHMRPAGGLDNPSAGEQLVEPGIAVGVNDAAEVRGD